MGRRMRTCTRCGNETYEWCPTCIDAFKTRTPAKDMTREERAAELVGWYGVLEIPFEMMQHRFEELLGRPVWTHEMIGRESFVKEILRGSPRTAKEFIESLPENAIIVTVEV